MLKKVICICVLFCFVFNITISDYAYSYTPNAADLTVVNLSAASVNTDMLGIQHKDVGRLKMSLQADLMQLFAFKKQGAKVDFSSFEKFLGDRVKKDDKLYEPAELHFFFHEAEETKEGVNIKCRVHDEDGTRTYYALVDFDLDSDDGFPIKSITPADKELKKPHPKMKAVMLKGRKSYFLKRYSQRIELLSAVIESLEQHHDDDTLDTIERLDNASRLYKDSMISMEKAKTIEDIRAVEAELNTKLSEIGGDKWDMTFNSDAEEDSVDATGDKDKDKGPGREVPKKEFSLEKLFLDRSIIWDMAMDLRTEAPSSDNAIYDEARKILVETIRREGFYFKEEDLSDEDLDRAVTFIVGLTGLADLRDVYAGIADKKMYARIMNSLYSQGERDNLYEKDIESIVGYLISEGLESDWQNDAWDFWAVAGLVVSLRKDIIKSESRVPLREIAEFMDILKNMKINGKTWINGIYQKDMLVRALRDMGDPREISYEGLKVNVLRYFKEEGLPAEWEYDTLLSSVVENLMLKIEHFIESDGWVITREDSVDATGDVDRDKGPGARGQGSEDYKAQGTGRKAQNEDERKAVVISLAKERGLNLTEADLEDLEDPFFLNVTSHYLETAEKIGLDSEVFNKIYTPDRVTEVKIPVRMDSGEIKYFDGYRIMHNGARGAGKGGIRFHPAVTRGMVRALSTDMSWKNAIVGIPYGGGKGGIAVDPREMSENEMEQLCRGFIRELLKKNSDAVGVLKDVPAPDVGSTAQHMGWMRDEYERMTGTSAAGIITGKSIDEGGSEGRTKATGQGVFFSAREAIRSMGHTLGIGSDMRKCSYSFQGAGNVAFEAIKIFFANGCSNIQYMSDVSGAIYMKNGLTQELLDKLESHLSNRGLLKDFSYEGVEFLPGNVVLEAKVDVLVPAALQNVITKDNADKVQAKIIVEGANGPTTPEADKILVKRGIVAVPDILANAGGVTVSYLEWLQNIQKEHWNLVAVDKMLEYRMVKAFENVYKTSKAYNISMREAANFLALMRVADAEVARSEDLQNRFGLKKPYESKVELFAPDTYEQLNHIVRDEKFNELIEHSEAKKAEETTGIAKRIEKRFKGERGVVLVNGPMAVGKALFSHNLKRELRSLGLKAKVIHYEQRPLRDIKRLLNGAKLGLTPEEKYYSDSTDMTLSVKEDEIIIIEGHHSFGGRLDEHLEILELPSYRIFLNTAPCMKLRDNYPFTSLHARMLRSIMDALLASNKLPSETLMHFLRKREGYLNPLYKNWDNADSSVELFQAYELPIFKREIWKDLLEDIANVRSELRNAKGVKEDDYPDKLEQTLRAMEELKYLLDPVEAASADIKLPNTSILRQFLKERKQEVEKKAAEDFSVDATGDTDKDKGPGSSENKADVFMRLLDAIEESRSNDKGVLEALNKLRSRTGDLSHERLSIILDEAAGVAGLFDFLKRCVEENLPPYIQKGVLERMEHHIDIAISDLALELTSGKIPGTDITLEMELGLEDEYDKAIDYFAGVMDYLQRLAPEERKKVDENLKKIKLVKGPHNVVRDHGRVLEVVWSRDDLDRPRKVEMATRLLQVSYFRSIPPSIFADMMSVLPESKNDIFEGYSEQYVFSDVAAHIKMLKFLLSAIDHEKENKALIWKYAMMLAKEEIAPGLRAFREMRRNGVLNESGIIFCADLSREYDRAMDALIRLEDEINTDEDDHFDATGEADKDQGPASQEWSKTVRWLIGEFALTSDFEIETLVRSILLALGYRSAEQEQELKKLLPYHKRSAGHSAMPVDMAHKAMTFVELTEAALNYHYSGEAYNTPNKAAIELLSGFVKKEIDPVSEIIARASLLALGHDVLEQWVRLKVLRKHAQSVLSQPASYGSNHQESRKGVLIVNSVEDKLIKFDENGQDHTDASGEADKGKGPGASNQEADSLTASEAVIIEKAYEEAGSDEAAASDMLDMTLTKFRKKRREIARIMEGKVENEEVFAAIMGMQEEEEDPYDLTGLFEEEDNPWGSDDDFENDWSYATGDADKDEGPGRKKSADEELDELEKWADISAEEMIEALVPEDVSVDLKNERAIDDLLAEIVKEEINQMLPVARQVGMGLARPVLDKEHTLFVSHNMFKGREYDEDKYTYASRFNLQRIKTDDPDRIVERVLGKISALRIDPASVIVQLPKVFSEPAGKAALDKLISEAPGIRFMVIDTEGMKLEDKRGAYRRNVYSLMLVARSINADTPKDSALYTMMRFFMKACLGEQNRDLISAYIDALQNNQVSAIIRTVLSYKPMQQYQMPDYDQVSATLIAA